MAFHHKDSRIVFGSSFLSPIIAPPHLLQLEKQLSDVGHKFSKHSPMAHNKLYLWVIASDYFCWISL
jgi:hypothetical protein